MQDKPETSLYLGIDLGGTKILTAIIDQAGNMLARDHSVTPAEHGPQAVMAAMEESAARSFQQAGLRMENVTAVGIGAPGPSNPDLGILYTSPNLPGWRDVSLVRIFEEKFRKKVYLINDANAAALSECYFGAAIGLRHVIYITVSTGIGGGIIIDGKLYTGAIGTAAELGHMTINDKGPLCNCGNFGCWEALASGTALEREARLRITEGAGTGILDYAGGDIDRVNAKTVHQAAVDGDETAGELIRLTGYYLGVGLANLLNMFNPEMIVIGGGLTNIGEMILAPAYETAKKRAYAIAYSTVKFETAMLGRNSGVLGAAVFAHQKSMES